MVTFPIYFVKGALNSAGWPRRVGFLRRRAVVDRTVLGVVYADLFRRAMTIGAGKPVTAVQLLADQFHARDWLTHTADELLRALSKATGDLPMRDIVRLAPDEPWAKLAEMNATFPQDPVDCELLDSVPGLVAWNFGVALRWGLGHPRAIAAALVRQQRNLEASVREARAAGLDLPAGFTAPSPRATLAESLEFVSSFQQRVRLLSAVPTELAAHPKVVNFLARGERWPGADPVDS